MPVVPSGVEESLDISESARDVSTCLDMANRLFNALAVYRDDASHAAAMNMAIDEALLESATVPSIRFYRWQSPALSFGYFGRFADVADYARERDLVRRWTGGGIVFHGDDLTYSIVIPANDSVFGESAMATYEKVHRALAGALVENGAPVELARVAPTPRRDPRKSRKGDLEIAPAVEKRRSLEPTVAHRRYNNCFADPVRADVTIDGRKVAGAAQRRTRCGLLQQGSIQGVDLENRLAERFATSLSVNCSQRKINQEILDRARQLAQEKYGTNSWLHKR